MATFDVENLDSNERKFLNDIQDDLPRAVKYLNEHSQLSSWAMIIRCLANRKLSLGNIAYQLFLDVVLWFCTGNICAKRYTETVRKFWRTGRELFKGKRFMSGVKAKGQISSGENKRGEIDTSSSKVNFIVPSRELLN